MSSSAEGRAALLKALQVSEAQLTAEIEHTRIASLTEAAELLKKEWFAARDRYNANPSTEREGYCMAMRDAYVAVRALTTKGKG